MGFFDDFLGDVLALTEIPWMRQVGLLLAAALVAYLPSRWLAGWLQRRRLEQESREVGTLRDLLQACIWPILAMALLAVALRVWTQIARQPVEHTFQVVPILGFFLLYRVVASVLRSLMVPGPRRRRLRRVIVPLLLALAALQQMQLLGPMLDWMRRPLFELGGTTVSLFSVVGSALVVLVFLLLGRLLGHVLSHRILPGVGMDRALSEAVSTVLRYFMVLVGLLVAFSTLGFDLTSIHFALGALGVGIGFGLQNIVNNFTSGLILLFERSVKRGDVLTVEGTDGRVVSIGLRASIIRTRAGDDIVMPNSNLVSNPVTNYSLRDQLKRVDVDVGVSYSSDPNRVREILLAAAESVEGLLRDPAPTVLFMAYGESSIDFQLRVWIDDAWETPQVRSALLFDIWYKLKAAGIEIPFPQRDIHLRSGELPIRRMEAEE